MAADYLASMMRIFNSVPNPKEFNMADPSPQTKMADLPLVTGFNAVIERLYIDYEKSPDPYGTRYSVPLFRNGA